MTAQPHDFVPGEAHDPAKSLREIRTALVTVRRSTPGSRQSWTKSGWTSISPR